MTRPRRHEPLVERHRAHRGSDVEAWIIRERDSYAMAAEPDAEDRAAYEAMNELLNDYLAHADQGVPLDAPVRDVN